jgi:trans-2,3-dihydro-3-hydroxyanthranilate isomerase
MRRRFTTLDVFTSQRFAGNPLAVVQDAEGLDASAMQTIAREFNLPETVFVLPASAAGQRAKLRIFTTAMELPFAGHPTVGAAVLLGLNDHVPESGMIFEEQIGPVRCRFRRGGEAVGHAAFDVPTVPEYVGEAAEGGALAAALSLTLDDLGCDRFEPGRWKAGNTFTMVPVRSLDAIGRAQPDLSRWAAAFGHGPPRNAFVFCAETEDASHAYRARMFAPDMGITEDPATGSAAAAFAGVVAEFAGLADGEHLLVIEQGYEMRRPSLINLTVKLQGGALAEASIAGDAIVVSEGTIDA